jgi:hypothetical protein
LPQHKITVGGGQFILWKILTVPEGDSAFGQIVGGKFQRHFVARQNAYAVPAQSAREVRQHHALMFQLDAEQPAGEFLEHSARYFYAVFLTHSTSFRSFFL